MEQFFRHKQDKICEAAIRDLHEQLDALGKVVEELAAENGKLKEELAARQKVTDDDLSAMESRITTRIEGLEDTAANTSDYSTVDGDFSVGGYEKWTVRKRKAAQAAADPSAFTKPRKKKEVEQK